MTFSGNRPLPVLLLASLVLAACGSVTQVVPPAASPAVVSAAAAGTLPAGWSRLRVPPDAWEPMARLGLDLAEDVDREAGTVTARLRPGDADRLAGLGVRIAAKAKAPPAGAFQWPAGYATVTGVQRRLRLLAERHPASCQVRAIGRSVEGRLIEAWRLSGPSRNARPVMVLVAGVHAREPAPVEVALALGEHLAEAYGRDASDTRLLDIREVWIVPLANPDARLRVEAGDPYWRKNARPLPDGRVGVDLNRNHDVHWHLGNPRTADEDYRGPEPASEPEARAVRDMIRHLRPRLVVDVHAFAGMVLWPPGIDRSFTPEESLFSRLARPVANRLAYRSGTLARVLYQVTGDVGSWALSDRGALGITVELDDKGFHPPFALAMKDWEDWRWPLRWWFEMVVDPLSAPLALPPEPKPLQLPAFGLSGLS
jgi:hypothetical protein